MKSKKYQRWLFSITAFFGLLGMALGQLIQGEFNFSVALGALTAALLIFIFELIKNLFKKDKTPDFDERTQKNLLKYYALLPNLFIGAAIILLVIVTSNGIEQVSINSLWIMIMTYIFVSGIGGFIVLRK